LGGEGRGLANKKKKKVNKKIIGITAGLGKGANSKDRKIRWKRARQEKFSEGGSGYSQKKGKKREKIKQKPAKENLGIS